MVTLICGKDQFKEMIRKRRIMGRDRLDEVWEGVYVMSPDPDIEHQSLGWKLSLALFLALDGVPGAEVLPSCNVTDQSENWTKNYRCPDLLVFLPGNLARNMGKYWLGGPDLAVEVLSTGDRARKKLEFYAKVGVRELLLVDRKRWRLELFRLADGVLQLVGKIDVQSTEILTSHILPVSFRMITGPDRPLIEIDQTEDARRWTA